MAQIEGLCNALGMNLFFPRIPHDLRMRAKNRSVLSVYHSNCGSLYIRRIVYRKDGIGNNRMG